jgi:Trk-type K+ transport system membrane component
VLESLGVAVARLAPNLAPIRRPRRATVTAAIVGAEAWTPAGPAAAAVAAVVALLATVWHPIPGIRPSAAAIYVVGATAIAAAFTVVTTAAIAAAAPLAARRAVAVHAFSEDLQVAGSLLSRRAARVTVAEIVTNPFTVNKTTTTTTKTKLSKRKSEAHFCTALRSQFPPVGGAGSLFVLVAAGPRQAYSRQGLFIGPVEPAC